MNPEQNNQIVVSHFQETSRTWANNRLYRPAFIFIGLVVVFLITGLVYALSSNHPSKSANLQASNTQQASKNGSSPKSAIPSSTKSNSPSIGSKTTASGSTNSKSDGSTSSTLSINSSPSSSAQAGSPTSSSSSGTTIWTGDFESGNLSGWINQSCPNGVTIVNNPVRDGNYAAAFTVTDQSTKAYCPSVPTSNPRAQLVGPFILGNGDNYYIGFSTYFPTNFPTTTSWFQFAEIYGPPYGGSPSMGFDVKGNNMTLDRDPTHNYDTIWTSPSPINKGTWEDIIVHVDFSTDPTVGYVELWLNGVPQTFTNGSTRIYYDTLVSGVNWNGSTPNALYLNQYRNAAVSMGSVTIYHDAARIGTSYDSVLP